MRAMVLESQKQPLNLRDVEKPVAGERELLIEVQACGICRTDLHVVDADLTEPKLPLIPGHQIVGTIVAKGDAATKFQIGERVGVPWLGGSCGHCDYCISNRENLCESAVYTGYQRDGGFAEYCVADVEYCFSLPKDYSDVQVAPLLCAGLIGYRAYRMVEGAVRIGLYGFGAAAHILSQVACYQEKEIYAFTRQGDTAAQQFALKLGANWAGDPSQKPPTQLDAAILFAPAGELVPLALSHVRKGGTVVCAGIHMSDIPSFPYQLLWGERTLRSVANLTREDGELFFPLAAKIPVRTEVHTYALEAVNQALKDLREGRFTGAAVIVP